MGLKLIAVFWLLVTVTVADEFDPTATLGRVRLVGLNASGATLVPVSLTTCGLVAALSVMVRAPVIDATELGAKLTLIVQLLDAASDVEQLLVWVKSPLVVIEPMESGPEPEFFRVTALEALVVPTAVLANVRLVGLTVAVPPEAIST